MATSQKAQEGRIAIVTGATGGIGPAIAKRLAKDGNRIVLTGRNADQLGHAKKELEKEAGVSALTVVADLAKYEEARRLVEEAMGHFGRIDILVNSAGGWTGSAIGAFVDKSETQLRNEIENNLMSTIWMCRAVAPVMLKQKYGRIVSISSTAALAGLSGHSAYSAAKAGQIGLARTLARELAPSGVTVNCVAPGAVATPFVKQGIAEGKWSQSEVDEWNELALNKRFAEPEEVADAVAFLVAENSAHITGQTLSVSGGMSML